MDIENSGDIEFEALKRQSSNLTSNHTDIMSILIAPIVLSIVFGIVILTSAASVFLGLIFWILIPSWRGFRNYAYLNLLLANTAFISVEFFHSRTGVFLQVMYYIFMVFTHWLIVVSAIFYFQFAKVFMKIENIRFIYLTTNVFGWLLPGLWITIEYFTSIVSIGYVCIVLVLINFALYVRGLIALFKPVSVSPWLGIGQKIVVATFAFVCTGVVMCAPFLIRIYDIAGMRWHELIGIAFCYVFTVMTVNIFFLMLKVHREKWRDYQSRETNNFI